MSDVAYIRPIDPPAAPEDVQTMASHAEGCFSLHRVDWVQSFLSGDGGRMFCWYRAGDAEAVRQALRQLGSDMTAVWPVNALEDPTGLDLSRATVVAEFTFSEPVTAQDEVVQRARGAVELAEQSVRYVLGFMSSNGMHLVCLYEAADALTAEAALDAARLEPERVWGCMSLDPKLTATS